MCDVSFGLFGVVNCSDCKQEVEKWGKKTKEGATNVCRFDLFEMKK